MNSIGYCRVSSTGQEDGTSLESQAARIRALAIAKDYDMVEVVQDVASGKSTARPGSTRVMELVESGAIDAVIVAKLDRLTSVT